MKLAIQDELFPELKCFGCGPANPAGLQLKSYRVGEHIEAVFTPWPEHDNGFGFLNGGIIATLLDCHSAAAVILESGRPGAGDGIFLTAGIDVRYRRPSPLRSPVELIAELESVQENEIVVATRLVFEDKVCATGLATWKRSKLR